MARVFEPSVSGAAWREANMAEFSSPTWEFHLPLAPADLLRSAGSSQYVVQEVLPLNQLPEQLAGWFKNKTKLGKAVCRW